MRILLSAYACEPNRGSEPGIGWNWALELAKLGHEVYVLTRANNEDVISTHPEVQALDNLKFLYFDHAGLAFRLKKKLGQLGVYWYYRTWQNNAYQFVLDKFPDQNFDIVHHITFGLHRIPSSLWRLKAPFVFGPLGGGEHATKALVKSMPLKARIAEHVRDFFNFLARHNPSLVKAFKHSDAIVTRTEYTRAEIPQAYRQKAFNHVDLGIHLNDRAPRKRDITGKKDLKILFVGRMLYWKGIHLALQAFQRLSLTHPHLSFTLIGSGKDKGDFQLLCDKLGISDKVDWVDKIPQQEVFAKYEAHDLFLFPSLHDSGGSVLLEAMSYGLPIVALNLGGPSVIVSEDTGALVEVEGKSTEEVIDSLVDRISNLIDDPALYARKSAHTCEKIVTHTWADQVRKLYEKIQSLHPQEQRLS